MLEPSKPSYSARVTPNNWERQSKPWTVVDRYSSPWFYTVQLRKKTLRRNQRHTMRWNFENISGWKFLAQKTFFGWDLEYTLWVASNIWVFVPDRVKVSFARLKRNLSVDVGLSVTHYMECRVLHWGGRYSFGQHIFKGIHHHCIPGNTVHRCVRICPRSGQRWHQWQSAQCCPASLHRACISLGLWLCRLFEVCLSATVLPGKSSEGWI